MKSIVRYQSRGGNTKAVAEVIAQALGTEALSVDNPVTEYTEVLFLGGGVYEWKMDKSLLDFMEQLSPDKIGQIVAFSTTGAMDSTLKQIRKTAEEKGIVVNKHELLVRMLLHGHSMLGLQGGRLTEKQLKKVRDFMDEIQEEI